MKPKYIALIGGALVILGSLLPWATVSAGLFSVSKTGTDGDGIFTLAAGVAVVLAALVAKETAGSFGSVLAGIFSLLAGAIAILDITNISRLAGGEALVNVSVGTGLYVILVGALIGLVGGFMRVPPAPASPSMQTSPPPPTDRPQS